MERAQQIAALRRELRSAFPSSHPGQSPSRELHGDHAGVSTGLQELDQLLTGQGLPKGRISELTGAPSCGKTTLALRMVAQRTRAGEPVAWIDLPGAFYPPSAAEAGVELHRLLLVRPPDLAGALKAADILLRGQSFPLVIFDWANDLAGDLPGQDLGAAVARLNGLCSLGKGVLLFITSQKTARDPLRYYATVRLEVRRESSRPAGTTPLARPAPEPVSMLEAVRPMSSIQGSMESGGAVRPMPSLKPVASLKAVEPLRPASETGLVKTGAEAAPLRLAGLPLARSSQALTIQVVKNKLGAPGRKVEVGLDGRETTRMPLHPGLPDPGSSAR